MICQKCKNQGVFVKMLIGSDYWYCRTCKDEIELEIVNTPRQANDDEDLDLLAEFERLIAEGDNNNKKPPNCSFQQDLDPWFIGGCK
jgi:hypothetical protein